MSPETRKEKPIVPRPTGGSNPQPACDLCGSVDPTHPSVTCWQKRIEELGAKNWELGVSPLTPPFSRHPILSLRRGYNDIVEELIASTVPLPTSCSTLQTPRA